MSFRDNNVSRLSLVKCQLSNVNCLHSAGFTLIEFLLYFTLSGVVVYAMSLFLYNLLELRTKNYVITEVEQQAQHVMYFVTNAVRNSKSIVSPSEGTSSDSLVLESYDAGKDPTTIDVSDGVIRVCEGTSCTPINLMATNVTASDVSFGNVSRADTPGSIQIQYTLSFAGAQDRQEFIYSKTYQGSATVRGSFDGGGGSPTPIPTTSPAPAPPGCGDQANTLSVDTSSASVNNRRLLGIRIENTDADCPITIGYMTVVWNNSRLIERIRIDGSRVWGNDGPGSPSGRQPSGTELDIVDVPLLQSDGSVPINVIRFNGNMSGRTFRVYFRMLDDSVYDTNNFIP